MSEAKQSGCQKHARLPLKYGEKASVILDTHKRAFIREVGAVYYPEVYKRYT